MGALSDVTQTVSNRHQELKPPAVNKRRSVASFDGNFPLNGNDMVDQTRRHYMSPTVASHGQGIKSQQTDVRPVTPASSSSGRKDWKTRIGINKPLSKKKGIAPSPAPLSDDYGGVGLLRSTNNNGCLVTEHQPKSVLSLDTPRDSSPNKPLPSLPIAVVQPEVPIARRSLIDASEKPLRRSVTPSGSSSPAPEDVNSEWPALFPETRPTEQETKFQAGQEKSISRMKRSSIPPTSTGNTIQESILRGQHSQLDWSPRQTKTSSMRARLSAGTGPERLVVPGPIRLSPNRKAVVSQHSPYRTNIPVSKNAFSKVPHSENRHPLRRVLKQPASFNSDDDQPSTPASVEQAGSAGYGRKSSIPLPRRVPQSSSDSDGQKSPESVSRLLDRDKPEENGKDNNALLSDLKTMAAHKTATDTIDCDKVDPRACTTDKAHSKQIEDYRTEKAPYQDPNVDVDPTVDVTKVDPSPPSALAGGPASQVSPASDHTSKSHRTPSPPSPPILSLPISPRDGSRDFDSLGSVTYRLKRLSIAAPDRGPTLRISEAADRIIMGHDSGDRNKRDALNTFRRLPAHSLSRSSTRRSLIEDGQQLEPISFEQARSEDQTFTDQTSSSTGGPPKIQTNDGMAASAISEETRPSQRSLTTPTARPSKLDRVTEHSSECEEEESWISPLPDDTDHQKINPVTHGGTSLKPGGTLLRESPSIVQSISPFPPRSSSRMGTNSQPLKSSTTTTSIRKSHTSVTKVAFSNFRGLFHKLTTEAPRSPSASVRHGSVRRKNVPRRGSPYPFRGPDLPLSRSSTVNRGLSQEIPPPDTSDIPHPETSEIQKATRLAMELLENARGEATAQRKARLLHLGQLMIEAVTAGRDAEKSMEEAKQAAAHAEIHCLETQRALRQISDLIDGFDI